MKTLTYILLSLLCIATILYSCSNSIKNGESENKLEVIKINPENHSSIHYSQLFDSLEYFVIPKDFNVCDIEELMIIEDCFYIVEAAPGNRLLQYTPGTNEIKQIGKTGEGPTEYSSISHIIYNWEDSLIGAFDNRQRKFLWYNLAGKYVKTSKSKHITANDYAYIGSGNLLINTNYFVSETTLKGETAYNIIITDSNNSVIGYDIPYPSNINVTAITRNRFSLTQYNKRNPLLYDLYNDTLYRVSNNGLTPYYTIDKTPFSIPEGINNSIFSKNATNAFNLSRHFDDHYCRIIHVLENDRYIYLAIVGKHIRRIFWDKKTRTSLISKGLPKDDLENNPEFYILCGENEYFYGYIDPSKLINNNSFHLDLDNENPILVKAKVKQ